MVNVMLHIFNYSAKKNVVQIHVTAWMNIKNILSEKSYTEKKKSYTE